MTIGTAVGLFLAFLFALLVFVSLVRSVRIVPQARAGIVERLGRYQRTLNPGLSLLMPIVDRIRERVDMREQVASFPPQPVITEDNLVVSIDTVIYFQVTDAKAATYEINELHRGHRAAHGDDPAQRDRLDGPRGGAHLA
jgi:regulator of protease activity HflC (stomatin/prohibitin superfamily)